MSRSSRGRPSKWLIIFPLINGAYRGGNSSSGLVFHFSKVCQGSCWVDLEGWLGWAKVKPRRSFQSKWHLGVTSICYQRRDDDAKELWPQRCTTSGFCLVLFCHTSLENVCLTKGHIGRKITICQILFLSISILSSRKLASIGMQVSFQLIVKAFLGFLKSPPKFGS